MKKLWLNDILETQRYILKLPQESEAEYMWNLITENTTKYMIWNKSDTVDETLKNIKETKEKSQKWTEWQAAIYDSSSWELIGRCWINTYDEKIPSFQIWYWISEKHYGKWIVPECVKRLLHFAFIESSFEKVIIRCDSENINSQKVALKCWFNFEWEFKKYERINWKLRDTKFFGITKEDYLSEK
jgi:RimJ/RimL family protein N-acetyltransferase